jgi:protein-L-isoaspartate(D-aspartate) O-methyltransferase
MKDLALDREKMVRTQIERRGIKHPGILTAMRQVPRHLFVSMEYHSQAYADHPLPIGYDQTISQPYIVALMSELIQPQADDKVLEVGSGSGYQAAILSYLVAQVHSIERHSGLVKQAQRVINELNLSNVKFHVGDGSLGLPEYAPFDAIIITAAAPHVPRPLLEQLNIGGRLVLPVGERWHQTLERWTKTSKDTFEHDQDIPVSFVPLVGKFGWSDSNR